MSKLTYVTFIQDNFLINLEFDEDHMLTKPSRTVHEISLLQIFPNLVTVS